MNTRFRLLIVDDDDLLVQSVRMAIPEQWKLTAVTSRAELRTEIERSGSPTAAFVDMHLRFGSAGAEGLEAIADLRAFDSRLEIVAISGDLSRHLMEACLRAGAARFLGKPLSPEEICSTLAKIEAFQHLRLASERGLPTAWVGDGPASRETLRQIAELRGESGPILLEGESGTGKEVCAALIPEQVFESEFFGHVRGAFTGADQNKIGLAEAAHGGDLFLDEIDALPLNQQAKLLRYLENGEIRRVGSKETTRVNARVIAATNQNLSQMVREGRFREDLLWRLGGKRIVLPPLRERREDIPALVELFLSRERPRRNKSLTDDAKAALMSYAFPGNVRELKRLCERLSLSSPLPIVRAEDVARALPAESAPCAHANSTLGVYGDCISRDSRGLPERLAEFEAEVIRHALANAVEAKQEIDETARMLKISRSSLYKKLKDYGISPAGSRAAGN